MTEEEIRKDERNKCSKEIKVALRAARRGSEYANGYNSRDHIGGRLEGLQIAIYAISGCLMKGQWNSYKAYPPSGCEPKETA